MTDKDKELLKGLLDVLNRLVEAGTISFGKYSIVVDLLGLGKLK
jgi:hypothetical protein